MTIDMRFRQFALKAPRKLLDWILTRKTALSASESKAFQSKSEAFIFLEEDARDSHLSKHTKGNEQISGTAPNHPMAEKSIAYFKMKQETSKSVYRNNSWALSLLSSPSSRFLCVQM